MNNTFRAASEGARRSHARAGVMSGLKLFRIGKPKGVGVLKPVTQLRCKSGIAYIIAGQFGIGFGG